MPESITPKDISEYIRLKKLRAELSFKKEYLMGNGSSASSEIDGEFKSIDGLLSAIESKFQRFNFTPVVPNETRINELSEQINSQGHAAIAEALRSRSGSLYDLLTERGKLIRQNFDARDEIGKLNIFVFKLDEKSKVSLLQEIRSGTNLINGPFKTSDDKSTAKLKKIMKRLKIYSELVSSDNAAKLSLDEVEVSVDNKKVWVSQKVAPEVEKNNQNLTQILAKIQLKNAERQIKLFSDMEEKEFAKLQHEYLELLKQKDELLKEHYEECSEQIVRN